MRKVHYPGSCPGSYSVATGHEDKSVTDRARDVTCGACRQRICKVLLDTWSDMSPSQELVVEELAACLK